MKLLQSLDHPQLGHLKNRTAMSAMTRSFAGPQHIATEAMAAYYGRRAREGVAIILTEGIIIDPIGDGYPTVPYLITREQAESWKPVIREVHGAGSKIFAQLWHCGRISHEDFTGGVQPVSSTARRADGINRQNNKPYAVPRALLAAEMPGIYENFRKAAVLALEAGFDGVQLHCGHGYLIDQFLDGHINDRTDSYGGSLENRCRALFEVTETVLNFTGPDRCMVRVSPARHLAAPYEWADMEAMLPVVARGLDRIGLKLLDVSCANADYFKTSGRVIRAIRSHWKHTILGGASLSFEQAEAEVQSGLLDVVTWGRHLIANPDLVRKFSAGEALQPFDRGMLETLT